MNKKYTLLIFLYNMILFGNQNPLQITPKYENLKLINKWTFESMETTTFSETEEKEIVYKDEDNIETLTFHRSGSMSFVSLDDGNQKKGRGIWFVNNDLLRIIADSDTVDATYQIKNNILTIITNEEESEDFYGYKSIVRYLKE